MTEEEKKRSERVEIFCWIGILAFIAFLLIIAGASLNS